jgi:hypothetical protein
VRVHHETVYRWVDAHPDFAEAVSIGHSLGMHEMEKLSRLHYYGKKVDGFDPKRADARHLEFRMKSHKTQVYSITEDVKDLLQTVTLNYNLDAENGKEARAQVKGLSDALQKEEG